MKGRSLPDFRSVPEFLARSRSVLHGPNRTLRGMPSAGWAVTALMLFAPAVARAADAPPPAAPAPAAKAPPLPLHTIDGVGGVVITPIAYLVNPGAPGTVWALPSVSATYVNAREKNIETLAVTETLRGRVELGYAVSRFGLGTLPGTVKTATTIDIGRSDVYLHIFNVRGLVIKEGSFGKATPAVTIGIQAKYNDGISQISDTLTKGAGKPVLNSIGFHNNFGIDYVATATKLIPKVVGRPLIVSGGFRLSEADQTGYAGFGNAYVGTFEGNVVYLVTNKLAAAAEYRQKRDQYTGIPNVWGKENDWWTVGAGYVANSHLTATVGYGHFGHVLDTVENGGWALSGKYEF